MVKCAACGKYIAAKGGAICSNISCSNRYHFACLLLPETTQMNSNWKCPDCKKKVPKGDNSCTPVKQLTGETSDSNIPSPDRTSMAASPDIPTTHTDTDVLPSLRDEIKMFRSELREVRDELREFRREVAGLHTAFGDCIQRVDALEVRLEALENKQIAILPENISLTHLQHTITRLEHELNDRDQEALCTDLEISNIAEIPGENVLHTVGLVASKLGIGMEDRDIVFAQRVGSPVQREPAEVASAPRPRRIVVRLARRSLRDTMLQGARVRRGVTTADLGLPSPPRRFYVNERLTRTNKHLFYRVREAAGRLGWRYTWTKYGRILTKQTDGKQTYCIRTEEDLHRVFGLEIIRDKN